MKSSESHKAKILVVDDYVANRVMAAAFLSLEGYEVFEADSGREALALVSEINPDLILLDMMMPEMDGLEVCRRLKQNEETRPIPIIFITVMNDQQSRMAGIEAGGDDYITKPFNPLELSARVSYLIRQKHVSEDLNHTEQVLISIARTVEGRDPKIGDHCDRLAVLGLAFGEFLDLSRIDINNLSLAGYLHDIGKIGIPESVLLKTGKLLPAEWEIMKQHVLIGEQICQPLRTMRGVLPIIRHHHERWDGSGYPDRMGGEEIPYLAQVFQIIEIYEALINERSHKTALTPKEALEILTEESKRGWRNPKLVQEFAGFISRSNNDTLRDRDAFQRQELFQIETSWMANDIINTARH